MDQHESEQLMQTVVGMYRTVEEANKAKQALLSEGYSGGDVTVIDQSESSYRTGQEDTNAEHNTVGGKIKHFFEGLTGSDEDTHRSYTEGVTSGGALVAVNVSEGEEDRAAEVLSRHGARDIQGDDNGYGASSQGTTRSDFDTNAAYGTDTKGTVTDEQVIPIVQEELQVGKREVQRGGVKVYSRVVSENVSENVNLHDERVVVDRRTVNRAATDADFTSAGPIEVRAMGEEAVVGKVGRVVEEVVVGKQSSDRTETVADTVRHTEVDVEPVTTTTGSTTTTSKY